MAENHHVFSRLLDDAKATPPIPTAVVWPLSAVALEGVCDAAAGRVIEPVLIGPASEMVAIAGKEGLDISGFQTAEVGSEADAAAKGVELCLAGKTQILMKGSLHTDVFMHAAMQDATGLRTHRRTSHVFIFDVPSYPRMLMITDAAVNITPGLMDKADIVQNAIDLAHVLGLECPKVAILSAVETVNPKIQSTIDAAALCKMADRGQITGGLLDGPLAFDNAVNLQAAEIKHITSPVAGQADILIVPDLESGNMLSKQLEYLAGAEAAGIVLGARVPIVLTSRADGRKARMASAAVAAMLAHARVSKTDAAVKG
ncbi:Phosphate acetyltransferase [Hartmannibacter diazotrophicus]|uniref:Phosphate acetyltransferase n=1 Tax=Hartmannibacter diazotrophicus TaxID=1482074 RepID=A0A2C9D2B3_9HYPH|nr:bifunctional enoyl-CoA hydratase/phosphate acetyltransferase [Hartmannibacter diazotrophicus]SON54390.1 Phosphate acetyltransferase [Hartmannibacter diazotrophicus]